MYMTSMFGGCWVRARCRFPGEGCRCAGPVGAAKRQDALPSCASPDPARSPSSPSRRLDGCKGVTGCGRSARVGEAEWQGDVEALWRHTRGPVSLARDTRQPIEGLGFRSCSCLPSVAADIRLLTEHPVDRHAIPIHTTVSSPFTSALVVHWSAGRIHARAWTSPAAGVGCQRTRWGRRCGRHPRRVLEWRRCWSCPCSGRGASQPP